MKLILWAIGASAVLGMALFLLSPLNRLVMSEPTGRTPQQEFPIHVVGQDIEDARALLEADGIIFSSEVTSGRCANLEIHNSHQVFMFRDRSWRRGVVCLFEQGGQVDFIGWWYSPGAP